MKKNNVNELICRLMSGETTPEEERQLLQLLRSQSSLSSEEKAILQFLDAAFQGRPQAMREADAESILPSENADEKRIVNRKGWGLRQIAAAVLLLLCLSGICYAAIRWLAPRQEKRSEEWRVRRKRWHRWRIMRKTVLSLTTTCDLTAFLRMLGNTIIESLQWRTVLRLLFDSI